VGIGVDDRRCSTDQQDLTLQHSDLLRLGVAPARIYCARGIDCQQSVVRPFADA
jgi:hypothetical protein